MPATVALIVAFALRPPAVTVTGGSTNAQRAFGPTQGELPQGASPQKPASAGATELKTQGKFGSAAKREQGNATEFELSGGALLSSGNARSFQATGAGRFRLRRGRHQFGSAAAANHGRAATDVDSPVRTTVSNVQGMVRYDYFFAKHWSAFAMTTARSDRFQGLDLRLNVDPGVALYALTDPKHQLWFELGYDFQYDDRRSDALFADIPIDPNAPDGERQRVQVESATATNHAARVFAGYSNQLSDLVSLHTGVEYLQSLLEAKRIRVNWASSLTAGLANRLGLATTFTLRFENQPLAGLAKLDTITALLLTVKFL